MEYFLFDFLITADGIFIFLFFYHCRWNIHFLVFSSLQMEYLFIYILITADGIFTFWCFWSLQMEYFILIFFLSLQMEYLSFYFFITAHGIFNFVIFSSPQMEYIIFEFFHHCRWNFFLFIFWSLQMEYLFLYFWKISLQTGWKAVLITSEQKLARSYGVPKIRIWETLTHRRTRARARTHTHTHTHTHTQTIVEAVDPPVSAQQGATTINGRSSFQLSARSTSKERKEKRVGLIKQSSTKKETNTRKL